MEKEILGLQINSYDSLAKCISILRKYEPVSMGVLKNRITNKEYAISCGYTDARGLKTLIRCYEELIAANITVSIFEMNNREASAELLYNLDRTYDSIMADIEEENEQTAHLNSE